MRTTILTLFLIASAAPAGPAPVHKAPPPALLAPVVGTWDLTFNGTRGRVTFERDGTLACDWLGNRWAGTWTYDAPSCRLRVDEQILNAPHSALAWEVTLDPGLGGKGRLRGTLDGSPVEIQLTRPQVTD